jgi:hypothetical protein
MMLRGLDRQRTALESRWHEREKKFLLERNCVLHFAF